MQQTQQDTAQQFKRSMKTRHCGLPFVALCYGAYCFTQLLKKRDTAKEIQHVSD
ncbi:hypothetical protein [Pantoea sp. BAV 3049]|uniref:hypothetical protein n=1 Tax=Pantoea sp. BAV 3049 TaxID=2654188 RepID=UPI00131C8645|nr:hypothetical protein [Pantoea sp. BAV 3049]